MSPLVAVCVCTRARPKMLRRCLASLRRQRLDPARLRMKLIVVDNNDRPEARPIYQEMCDDPDGTGLVHCPEPGIPRARNAAIDAALRAGADYIAFLDDDEIAPENWIASLVEALRVLGADAVQGGVRHHPMDLADSVDVEPCLAQSDSAATLDWEACESLATCNVVLKAHLVRPPLA
ncbi:MAG TPA: glycosyltransferase family 2 protein, partial [Hyphomicrobiaceae bacterium]|nr:glycosyltransferase family 2 protein [Hyphomicrobiaceae bacterium]